MAAKRKSMVMVTNPDLASTHSLSSITFGMIQGPLIVAYLVKYTKGQILKKDKMASWGGIKGEQRGTSKKEAEWKT